MERDNKHLIIDLDDTIIDTFNLLITPLENKYSDEIIQYCNVGFTAKRLAEILISLRRSNPYSVEVFLQCLSSRNCNQLLEIRKKIFSNVPYKKVWLCDKVHEFLRAANANYVLTLLTEGNAQLQQNKINHLGLSNLFHHIVILHKSISFSNKYLFLKNYIETYELDPSIVTVIGNRLDNEILAGQLIGANTIWIQHGEGSAMQLPLVETLLHQKINRIEDIASISI